MNKTGIDIENTLIIRVGSQKETGKKRKKVDVGLQRLREVAFYLERDIPRVKKGTKNWKNKREDAMTVGKDLASSRKNINGESYSERECKRVEPIRVHGNNGPESHIPGKRNEELTLMQ